MPSHQKAPQLCIHTRRHGFRAFQNLLPASLIQDAACAADVAMGCGSLWAPSMVMLAVYSAIDPSLSFAQVLTTTLKWLQDSESYCHTRLASIRKQRRQAGRNSPVKRSRHDPRSDDPASVSEEAFVQARRRLPWQFWVALLERLVESFQQSHGGHLFWNGFRLLALDGTTLSLPNRKTLLKHFGAAANGHSKRAQARMVMLQFPLARLPFRYELTPLAEGERTIARRLLDGLRCNDLVLMDQGFWCFQLFHQIQTQHAFFAIRLYPSVKPRKIRPLGPQDWLVEWQPSKANQCGDYPRSIQLRLIEYHIPGFRPTALVTNVLCDQQVAREQWIHLANREEEGTLRLSQGLYHRRWEIETTFYELKVTQAMTAIRSRTAAAVQYEVVGHVILYFLTRWLIVQAAEAHDADPLRISFKNALIELLALTPLLVISSTGHVEAVLIPRLLNRLASHHAHFRPGRKHHRPRDQRVQKSRNRKTKKQT